MVESIKEACKFMEEDTFMWPGVVSASDIPKDHPCPLPKVNKNKIILEFFNKFLLIQ